MNLADALVTKTFQNDEVIVNQGDVGDGMYFVEEGQIAISMVGNDGVERKVKRVNRHKYFVRQKPIIFFIPGYKHTKGRLLRRTGPGDAQAQSGHCQSYRNSQSSMYVAYSVIYKQ